MSDQRLDLSAKFVPPKPAGLVRGRLVNILTHRVSLVLAPAGHGKTTLLGQIAASFDGPVAWYRIDAADRDPAELSSRLRRVLQRLHDQPATGDAGGSGVFERLAAQLEAVPAEPGALLVLDDFHAIAGTESERGLARLISTAPPPVRVLLGARRAGGLDVEALRIYGEVRILDADDLRFRSWEVEELFREVYQRPLAPEEAATLTRRTEGWAAGLAMFNLVTAGRAPAQRRRALADLARGSRLVRSYLVREVLGELPRPLRDFMRRTSALGVLSGSLCDALLDTTGSQAVLEELEQRRIFTTAQDDGRQFAYHQVLRDHLELELTEELGRAATRAWYVRAGHLLLEAGEVPAAFRAYARAEDWDSVEQLLHLRGAEVVATPLGAVENLLPVALHAHDPWLLLARARQLVTQGALAEAVTTFTLARSASEDAALAARCLAEARAAAIWLPDAGGPLLGWAGLIRAATRRNPRSVLAAALDLPGSFGPLAGGVVALLAGDLDAAGRLFGQVAVHPDTEFDQAAMAGCGQLLIGLLSGGPPAWLPDLESLLLEVGNRPWLIQVARALLTVGAGAPGPELDPGSDSWAAAAVALVNGVAGRDPEPLTAAAARFDRLGAPVPAQWAACLAEALRPPPDRPGARWSGPAGQQARTLGLRDMLTVVDRWASTPSAEASSPTSPTPDPATPDPAARVAPAELAVRLFGGLEVARAGTSIDLRGVRPRARSTLRLLALHAGELVHRDTLAAQLWPDLDQESALRGLQVAVSSLRTLLDGPGAARSGGGVLLRVGQNYRLTLPDAGRTDVQHLELSLAEARSARAADDRLRERAALETVLRLYTGDLLPEEGTAEWVLGERERLRLGAAGAGEALARVLLDIGETAEAIEAVRSCLRLDPYRDSAWRLLIDLHAAAGNPAAAEAARLEHGQVLADLGL